MENLNDTIVAISTGSTSGAISIVRLSGKKAIEIADKMFTSRRGKLPSTFVPRMLELGKINTGKIYDEAFCVIFKEPNSYTAENLVEIQCHGGLKIASGIVSRAVELGARPATNGEFTKRAFINGRISLAAAEGVMDLINAETDAQIRAGYDLLSGELGKLAKTSQDELTDILSEIEVSFDYPEEQIEYITKKQVAERLDKLIDNISNVLSTAGTGELIKNGIKVLIVGKPNVGKSSLLNKLLARERALVTDVPGTTRDTVEDSFTIGGIVVNIIDTAGIHQTTDIVEKLGVDKAKNLINSADIILFVTDASQPETAEDKKIYDLVKGKNYIKVKNKSDISKQKNADSKCVFVSSVTGEGLEELKQKIYEHFSSPSFVEGGIILTNARHKEALSRALDSLVKARQTLNETLDLVSIDLKLAYSALGEITGNTTGEDIIDSIFKKFCLGK